MDTANIEKEHLSREDTFLDAPFLQTGTTNGEILYGREVEKELLLKQFHQRLSPSSKNEDNDIVLVTGQSGTGKTALVANTLKAPVVEKNGYFISGKFDQFQKPEPYSIFVAAFTNYVHLVIGNGEDIITSTQQAIIDSVGPEISLLIEMIPAIELLVGSQSKPAKANINTQIGAQKRHKAVFCKFVKSICSYTCPLVLLIDDMQWFDSASVDLLEALIMDKEIQGLMIVGTCRHDEISCDHKLSAMLRNLEDNRKTPIINITLRNFSKERTRSFLSNLLQQPESYIESFSNIVYKETNGNTFYVLEYLKNLHDKKILYKDKIDSTWRIESDSLASIRSCRDVVELLRNKIETLPYETQELLMVASCIGADFDEYLLYEALTISNVADVVSSAVDLGFIVPIGEQQGYRFTHDKIQQAAYCLIPEEERNDLHLYIGRRLLKNLPAEELGISIFIVVNQLSQGVALMKHQKEKNNLSSLCLQAGEKAALSSDFVSAASYLHLGIDVLDENHWRDEYFMSLDLYNAAAEMEYCNANYAVVDNLCEAVITNARILRDKVRAYTTEIYSLGARKKTDMAIRKGFYVLKLIGQPFPKKASKVNLICEFIKTKRMVKKAELFKLRKLIEWEIIAAMQILNILVTYTFISNDEFAPLLGCRVIQLTIKNGLSPTVSPALGLFGLMHCARGKYEEGFNYGQLAIEVLEKFNDDSWLPRVYVFVHGMINIYFCPLREALCPLREAHNAGLRTGDIEYAMAAAFFASGLLIHSGQVLDESLTEVSKYYELMSKHKQDPMLLLTNVVQQVMLNFMGESCDPLVLTGDVFDETSVLKDAINNSSSSTMLNLIYMWKMVLAYYFCEYEIAFDMALETHKYKLINRVSITGSVITFYHGLSCLALAQQKHNKKKKYVTTAKKCVERIKQLATHCPENFSNKLLLMEAEFAVLENKIDIAVDKYDSSIEIATSEGLRHEHALACERKGRALMMLPSSSTDFNTTGQSFVSRACSLYDEWGAKAKVEHLRKTILQ